MGFNKKDEMNPGLWPNGKIYAEKLSIQTRPRTFGAISVEVVVGRRESTCMDVKGRAWKGKRAERILPRLDLPSRSSEWEIIGALLMSLSLSFSSRGNDKM